MQWFYNLKIRTKLFITFGIILMLTASLGLFSIRKLSTVNNGTIDIATNWLPSVKVLSDINYMFARLRVSQFQILLSNTQQEIQKYENDVEERLGTIRKYQKIYEPLISSHEESSGYEKYKSDLELYVSQGHQLDDLVHSNKRPESISWMRVDMKAQYDKVVADLNVLINLNNKGSEESAKLSADTFVSSRTAIIVVLIISMGLGLLLALFITRTISQPLNEMGRQAEVIASGDLTVLVHHQSHDEIGKLAESFRKMVNGLRETLQQVMTLSSAVASASSEISSSTEEMAAGAQEQTSQAGEVASAVEEMTKTIIENSKNAGSAAATARQAKQSAEQGGRVVDQTIRGMKEIAKVVRKSASTVQELGKSSDQIGKIISVIDDIADQTNLLALNAAIEAARAGEQGRGFAVVADEVRKLAERTTKATKEIADMIKKIQSDTKGAVISMDEGTSKVDEGIAFADQAGVALKEIVATSQQLTDMVAQIAVASEQQSSASEQISKNVEAISAVTSETATGNQQIARASEDLNRLTENLQQLVERFRLDQAGTHRQQTKAAGMSREKGKASVAVRASGKFVTH
ncbi:MAG TPA: methyl-accepting chemotaxis protein [Bacteroidota bacterium]|nr:methyl-accepting chemotaxis protein [Bacteroidota bacterium]